MHKPTRRYPQTYSADTYASDITPNLQPTLL